METRAHYVAVGAFVLTMMVLAFAAVLWLGRAELTTQYANYDIYFIGPVSGLRDGAVVEYSGVPVGKVSDIRIDPTNVEQIRVTVEIDSSVAIKADAAAAVETNLLSGVSYIQVVGGTQDAPLLLPQPGQRYAVIRSHRSRFASIAARAPQILEKASDTLDSLNELLDEKNRRAVAETLEHIRVLSDGLGGTNKDIDELAVNAKAAVLTATTLLSNVDRSYSGPDGLGNKAGTALADFDRVAKDVVLTLQDARPGIRTFSQQTLSDVGALVGEARQLISGVSRLVATIERDPSRVLLGDRREGYRPK
jgi:phospholipid/cholesterol/gamma-HCH transport system substrate-binding protein